MEDFRSMQNYLTGAYREKPFTGGKCPRCDGSMPQGYPGALSRRDNKTEICSQCGVIEAMEDFSSYLKSQGR